MQQFYVGLGNSSTNDATTGLDTSTNGIYFKAPYRTYPDHAAGESAALYTKYNGVFSGASTTPMHYFRDETDRKVDYHYRVELKYLKETAAMMKISRHIKIGGVWLYECVGTATQDLSNKNFGNLRYLYIGGGQSTVRTTYVTSGGTYGDGSYVLLEGSAAPNSDYVVVDEILVKFTKTYVPTWTVSAPIAPNGSGSVDGAPAAYSDGAPVTLTAQNTSPGYLFNNWSSTTAGSCPDSIVGSTSATVSFLINRSVNCTANFGTAPILTVSANNSAYGTTGGSGTYKTNTVVSISATPAAGYAFSHWSGCISSTTTPLYFTVTGTTTCTANFYAKVPVYWFTGTLEYFLSTDPAETGGGAYTNRGIGWYSPSSAFSGAEVVDRYVNRTTGRHFFIRRSTYEVSDPYRPNCEGNINNHPVSSTWHYEGPAFYVFPPGTPGRIPVYRYYLPGTDAHLYSTGYGNPTYAGYTLEGEVWRVANW